MHVHIHVYIYEYVRVYVYEYVYEYAYVSRRRIQRLTQYACAFTSLLCA